MTEFAWITGNDPNIQHQSRLGSGGFGEVHAVCSLGVTRLIPFKMRDINSKMFARKILRPNFNTTQGDLANEIRVIDKLCSGANVHRNIVKVFKHGQLNGSLCYFIDMELGESELRTYLKNTPPLLEPSPAPGTPNFINRLATLLPILIQILDGLIYIHSHKEVHRDIKPENSNRVS